MPGGNFEKECRDESQDQEDVGVGYKLSCAYESHQNVAMLSPKSQPHILERLFKYTSND
jgi:hypothetical protein